MPDRASGGEACLFRVAQIEPKALPFIRFTVSWPILNSALTKPRCGGQCVKRSGDWARKGVKPTLRFARSRVAEIRLAKSSEQAIVAAAFEDAHFSREAVPAHSRGREPTAPVEYRHLSREAAPADAIAVAASRLDVLASLFLRADARSYVLPSLRDSQPGRLNVLSPCESSAAHEERDSEMAFATPKSLPRTT